MLTAERFSEFLNSLAVLKGKKEIVVLFSGGKDCSVLLHLLVDMFQTHSLSINLHPVTVVYPKHMYLSNEFNEIKSYWQQRSVQLNVLTSSVQDPEDCLQCKVVRKKLIDPFIQNFSPTETVIFSGYTLIDYLAYWDQLKSLTIFSHDSSLPSMAAKQNFLRHLVKLRLVQDLPNNYRICRPLGWFHWSEVEDYVECRDIPCIHAACQNYSKKYKRIHENRLKQEYFDTSYTDLLQFLAEAGLSIPDTFPDADELNYFPDC